MRVRHRETNAEGTVLREFVLPAATAGNCAGLWYLIDFDDGLQCTVPAALTATLSVASEQPLFAHREGFLETAPEPHFLWHHSSHCFHIHTH